MTSINYWLDVISCIGIVIFELFAIFTIALLIQLMFYRVFKINLYKIINKKIDKILQ